MYNIYIYNNIQCKYYIYIYIYGGFHQWGTPIDGWFIMENPITEDDLGVPLFLETTTYIYIYKYHNMSQNIVLFISPLVVCPGKIHHAMGQLTNYRYVKLPEGIRYNVGPGDVSWFTNPIEYT